MEVKTEVKSSKYIIYVILKQLMNDTEEDKVSLLSLVTDL